MTKVIKANRAATAQKEISRKLAEHVVCQLINATASEANGNSTFLAAE